jgi:diguanylate cyclase (GGDEF)-like protein
MFDNLHPSQPSKRSETDKALRSEPSESDWADLEQLRQENQQLRQRCRDLELALSTTTEHGDIIEAELYQANEQLRSEAQERIKAELTLQTLMDLVTRQKKDLEIIVQTIMEHGDTVDNQWHQKFCEAMLLAELDGLTQIPNRRRFNEYLEQQWKRLQVEQLPLALVMADIDFFKPFNDTYGHPAGDICLKQVALGLSQCLMRSSDLVARYGGEEFAIVLPATDLEGAVCVAERVKSAIANLNIAHSSSPISQHVTLSLGVASLIPSAHRSTTHLILAADRELYRAKQQGRNTIMASHS